MKKKLFLLVFVFATLLLSFGCSKTNTQSPPKTTIPPSLPIVSTFADYLGLTNINNPHPTIFPKGFTWDYGGLISDNGGLKIIDSGVILINYSTNSTKRVPFQYNYIIVGYPGSQHPPVKYSVQAYATNSLGTGYGKVISF